MFIMQTLILLGQTAVGKTKLSIELAKEFNAEIISADSMQVYRGMDIGTAKPTLEERQGVPHHLIDIRNPDEDWTVSDFIEEVSRISGDMAIRKRFPVIVGGTGLYLWSLLEGFKFPIVPADKTVRQELEKSPTSALYSQLSTIDPISATKIHANDRKRIIRALEVYRLTGKPISEVQGKRVESGKLIVESWKVIGLQIPREELYVRINSRVDNMIEKGLVEEVKSLLAKYPKDLKAFQALGYKEVINYLDGKWNKDQMIEELKKRTRNFAKRQMTWFKRFQNVNWIDSGTDSFTVGTVKRILSQ